jgi:cytochrome c556
MTRIAKIAGSVALVATMLAPVVASAADDKDIIAYRQHLMYTLDAQSQVVGQMLSGVTPDKHGPDHLEIIALTASLSPKAFEPAVQGGESRPEVWTKKADFDAKMKAFVEGSARVADVGRKQGYQETMSIVLDALPCKGCHDLYRDPTKK